MINRKALALGATRNVIMELAEYGRQRAAIVGKENVYDFSIGNPSVPTPQEVNDTIVDIVRNMDSLAIHSYTAMTGDPTAREAIAQDLNRRFGTDADKDDLFLGCGAAPELVAVIKALACPDAEFLSIAPYFPEYKPYVEETGSVFRVVPADIPNFQIDFATLESMITPRTTAVIINNPNNPAGTVYSAETIQRLADLLTRKNAEYGHTISILADEPYRELVYDGVVTPFIPNIYPHTVVCYSYSKSLSLPGERMGYVYVPKSAADNRDLYSAIVGAARVSGHVCAPSLMQRMITRCAHLQPELTSYDRNRRVLMDALLEYGYEMAKPEGAFYLFVKAPNGDDQSFYKKALEKDLLFVPGAAFGCPGYFRLCYCISYDTIVRSLPLFKQLMDEV